MPVGSLSSIVRLPGHRPQLQQRKVSAIGRELSRNIATVRCIKPALRSEDYPFMLYIGELGTDFTKWPTVKHFASWPGLCPNWKKTGGKVKSSATRKGKNRAATALRLAAWSLLRSKNYLGAYLRRQR